MAQQPQVACRSSLPPSRAQSNHLDVKALALLTSTIPPPPPPTPTPTSPPLVGSARAPERRRPPPLAFRASMRSWMRRVADSFSTDFSAAPPSLPLLLLPRLLRLLLPLWPLLPMLSPMLLFAAFLPFFR
jgi:hypothetical protein